MAGVGGGGGNSISIVMLGSCMVGHSAYLET